MFLSEWPEFPSKQTYTGCDKSLARPGRKRANVSVRMARISLGASPYRGKKTWWQLASDLPAPPGTINSSACLMCDDTQKHDNSGNEEETGECSGQSEQTTWTLNRASAEPVHNAAKLCARFGRPQPTDQSFPAKIHGIVHSAVGWQLVSALMPSHSNFSIRMGVKCRRRFWWGIRNVRDHLEDLSLDGRIMLKWILSTGGCELD